MTDPPGESSNTSKTIAYLALVAAAVAAGLYVHYTLLAPLSRSSKRDTARTSRPPSDATAPTKPTDPLTELLNDDSLPLQAWNGDPGEIPPPLHAVRLRSYRRIAMGYDEQFASYRVPGRPKPLAADYRTRAASAGYTLIENHHRAGTQTLIFTRNTHRLTITLQPIADTSEPATTLRVHSLTPQDP